MELHPEQATKIINDLEAKAAELLLAGDPHGVEHATERLARHYRRQGRLGDVLRVLRIYGDAYERAITDQPALVAAAWLKSVFEVYSANGMKADADRLAPLVQALNEKTLGELKAVEVGVSVSNAEFEAFVESLMGDSLDECLGRIAGQFITPDPSTAVAAVRRIAQEAPFTSAIGKTLLDETGRPTIYVGSVEEDLEGNVAAHLGQNLQFDGPFLRGVMKRAVERWSMSPTRLLSYLDRSPLFATSRQRIVQRGVEAYLQGDWIVAVHVLIPQVEAAVRRVLELSGERLVRPHRDGGLQLRLLDDLLRDPIVTGALSEQVTLYLRVVLTDARGWNIRNRVCHGTVEAAVLGPTAADRLLHVLLILAQVRASPRELPPELRTAIERRAYELFERRGRGDGRDWEDWFAAEKELCG